MKGGGIHAGTARTQHANEIAIADPAADVPPHAYDDHLNLELAIQVTAVSR